MAERNKASLRRESVFDRGTARGVGLGQGDSAMLPNPLLLKERWERAQGHDKLEVPAFLRRQMD